MWIMPTRERRGNLERAIKSFPEAPIHVWYTEGDETHEGVEVPEEWTEHWAPKGSTVPEILNRAFEERPREWTYGFIGDDVVPPKLNWWEALEGAARPFYFAYPLDSIHGMKLAPHFCVGGELVRAVGWLAAPWFHHHWIDNTWMSIALGLGVRRILPDLTFQHLHPLDPGSGVEDDPVYRFGRMKHVEDEEVFQKWLRDGSREELIRQTGDKLRGVL